MTNGIIGKKMMGGGKSTPIEGRKSNIELFRIITMLLIIGHHYVVNSGLATTDGPIYADPLSWRSLFLLLLGAWGKIGINCFVMITGYFMCKSHITAKKFAKLFLEWMFYRIVIAAIFYLTKYEAFTLKAFINLLIPIRIVSDGFISAYILFFMLIPFLNILIQHMNEKQHVLLLLWCAFVYVFMGTVPGFYVTMNYVSWFSVIYVIASYIRMYPRKIYEKTRPWGLLTLLFVILDTVSVIVCTWLGTKLDVRMAYSFVADSNTFLAVATGVCAFMYFNNVKIRASRLINTVAASTFGVLLIHANSDTMRQWLWKDTVNAVGHYDDPIMPLYSIGCVLIVFALCAAIDWLRIRFIEKPFFKYWDKHWDAVLKKYKEKEKAVLNKMGITQ